MCQGQCCQNVRQEFQRKNWGFSGVHQSRFLYFQMGISNSRDDRAERNLGVASVLLSTVIPWVGNTHLQQNPISDSYYLFVWRLPIAVILGYRFVLAVYCLVWLIYTSYMADKIMVGNHYIPWPAFLTNWTYFILTLYLTMHFVASVVYAWRRGGGFFTCPSSEQHCGLFHELHVHPSFWEFDDGEIVQERSDPEEEEEEEVNINSRNYTISVLLKVVWILYSIASNLCLMVTCLFWIFLWPSIHEQVSGIGFLLNFQLHAVTSIIILVEHLLSAVPVRLYHYIHTFIIGLIYVVFSVIYYAADKAVIYPVLLDWGKPGYPAVVVVVSSLVIGPMVHLFFFCMYKFKLFIYSKFNREHI